MSPTPLLLVHAAHFRLSDYTALLAESFLIILRAFLRNVRAIQKGATVAATHINDVSIALQMLSQGSFEVLIK